MTTDEKIDAALRWVAERAFQNDDNVEVQVARLLLANQRGILLTELIHSASLTIEPCPDRPEGSDQVHVSCPDGFYVCCDIVFEGLQAVEEHLESKQAELN